MAKKEIPKTKFRKIHSTDPYRIANRRKGRAAIDPDQVYELAKIHCTLKEMASILFTSVSVLETHFSDIIEMGLDEGNKSLRRAQYDRALAGSVPLLIWLGRIWLHQREEVNISSVEPEVKALMRKFDSLARTDTEVAKAEIRAAKEAQQTDSTEE
jgi:hypothetical protein